MLKLIAWIGLIIGLASPVWAQCQIAAKLDGTAVTVTVDANNDAVVEVGSFSGTKLLHIYDNCTSLTVAPGVSVRTLTVNGLPMSGGRLNVLIANSTATAFPANPDVNVLPGLVNVGEIVGGAGCRGS